MNTRALALTARPPFKRQSASAIRAAAEMNRHLLLIVALALLLRIGASLLLANTYDEDEFVYLSLGRSLAHGLMPYRDFAFFHPPGILVLVGLLDPVTQIWWPLARIASLLLDCVTVVLVWLIASRLWDRRAALIAAAFYAANPLVIVSAVRVDQEVPMTALMLAGLAILVTRPSNRAAGLSGACLAAAFWIKYPVLLLLPAFLLVSKGRNRAIVTGFGIACLVLFAPFLPYATQLFQDTVAWQLTHREAMPLGTRATVAAACWILASPLAFVGFRRQLTPLWLSYAFVVWGLFFATRPAVYPHYFVPAAAFGALLAARWSTCDRPAFLRGRAVGACVVGASTLLLLLALWRGPQPVFSSQFSAVSRVVSTIERRTPPSAAVLSNRLEYAYLAGRNPVAGYFWDDHDLVSAPDLERQLNPGSIAVFKPAHQWDTHPDGLYSYLSSHGPSTRVQGATLWFVKADFDPQAVADVADRSDRG